MQNEHNSSLECKQKTIYNTMDDFYKWLIEMAKDTYNQLKDDDFPEYYMQLINNLSKKRKTVAKNKMLDKFNADSVKRLNDILELTKDEHRLMAESDDEEKDFVYFNNLLGWYQAIPAETDMFIESLYKKQDD